MRRFSLAITILAIMFIFPGYVIKRGPAGETRSMYWGAGSISADNVNCNNPAETQISGSEAPKGYAISCSDNAGSVFYGSTVMPDGWDGGTVTFEMSAVNINADPDSDTPDSDYDIDFSVSCRGNSDIVNTTYGTAQSADIDFDENGSCGTSGCVRYELVQVTTSPVTGNGTCQSGDMLFWKGAMDAAGTTSTQVADIYIIGVKMEYTWIGSD